MGNVFIISAFKSYRNSEYLAQVFNVTIRAFLWLMQCRIPTDVFIYVWYSNLMVEGHLKKNNLFHQGA